MLRRGARVGGDSVTTETTAKAENPYGELLEVLDVAGQATGPAWGRVWAREAAQAIRKLVAENRRLRDVLEAVQVELQSAPTDWEGKVICSTVRDRALLLIRAPDEERESP